MHKVIVATLVATLLPLSAVAEEYATTKDAEMMVHRAVAYLKKAGKEKAFAAFSDASGQFRYRDLYVMVYDLNGVCLAHGAKKERIGRDFSGERDADGRLFVQERIELARRAGRGWQAYKFQNPVSKKIEDKVAYLELVDDVIVMSGAYQKK